MSVAYAVVAETANSCLTFCVVFWATWVARTILPDQLSNKNIEEEVDGRETRFIEEYTHVTHFNELCLIRFRKEKEDEENAKRCCIPVPQSVDDAVNFFHIYREDSVTMCISMW